MQLSMVASLGSFGYIERTGILNILLFVRKDATGMKPGIHPEYKKSTVTCVCGNTFETRTTIGDLKLEICSNCHPFFTGRQKLVDSAGRVERYNKKYGKKTPATADTPAA
jgi:large subunit ribosomal protein L31